MGRYLIDSNVISNYFADVFSEKAMLFLADVIDRTPNLSVITKIESLSWQTPNIAKENIVRIFVQNSNIILLCGN